MKRIFNLLKGSVLMLCLLVLACAQACKKDNGNAAEKVQTVATAKNNLKTASNADLIAYKASAHKLFLGFLVGDGNDPAAGFNPANAPDSADFLEFFAGRDTVKADWRAAQAKGTRIVACHFLSDAYFDGSSKDPATPGSTNSTPTSTSTYDHWAAAMYAQHITNDQLDGIDLDIESGTLGGQVPTTTQAANLLISVAKYFGPNCTSCTVPAGAKKPLFFYDTDGTGGGSSAAMYGNHKSNYDYVVFQSYTTGSHAWSGSGTADFPALVSTYGLDKLIFLVNGDSFKYPDGHEDQTGGDAKATSDLYSYANWVKTNNGTGVGVYRMSRDYNHTPPFAVSRNAIQIMNGTGGGTPTIGVTFYQNTNYTGTATSLIPKGNYTLAQLQAYGFVDNWASSVKVPTGWTVIMYTNDNFGSTSWTRTANTPNFTTLSPNANDKVTSVKIQ